MIGLNLNIKIFFLIRIILFFAILSVKSYSDNLEKNDSLIVLGSDTAIVKIKVFINF